MLKLHNGTDVFIPCVGNYYLQYETGILSINQLELNRGDI